MDNNLITFILLDRTKTTKTIDHPLVRIVEITKHRALYLSSCIRTYTAAEFALDAELVAIKAKFKITSTTPYLDMVIDQELKLGIPDRIAALEDIAISIDNNNLYSFAKTRGVLDHRESAEEFSIEFMTAYNKEVGHRY